MFAMMMQSTTSSFSVASSSSSSSCLKKNNLNKAAATTALFRRYQSSNHHRGRHSTSVKFTQKERRSSNAFKVYAAANKDDDGPKITRKNEAETEAFLSPSEKAGESPLKDPMAIIGIVGIIGVPALILLVGVTSGYIGQ
jgi:hypothetical protein